MSVTRGARPPAGMAVGRCTWPGCGGQALWDVEHGGWVCLLCGRALQAPSAPDRPAARARRPVPAPAGAQPELWEQLWQLLVWAGDEGLAVGELPGELGATATQVARLVQAAEAAGALIRRTTPHGQRVWLSARHSGAAPT